MNSRQRAVATAVALGLFGCGGGSGPKKERPPTSIVVMVSPPTAALAVGGTQPFSATVTGASSQSVVWSASGGSITQAGLYTAPGLGGNYLVKATSAEDDRAYGTAQANVTGTTLSDP